MAYTHTQYEFRVARAASLAATGDVGDYAPGYVPHRIRAVALVLLADPAEAGVVRVDRRPTAGSNTGRGDGDIAILNIAATHNQGDVIYKDGLDVELLPGEQAVAEVTDAVAGLTADVIFFVEPRWDRPGNNADLKATT